MGTKDATVSRHGVAHSGAIRIDTPVDVRKPTQRRGNLRYPPKHGLTIAAPPRWSLRCAAA
jgi:hypothetical protein